MLFSSEDDYDRIFGVHDYTYGGGSWGVLATSNITNPSTGIFPFFEVYMRENSSSPWRKDAGSFTGSPINFSVVIAYNMNTGVYGLWGGSGTAPTGLQIRIIEYLSDGTPPVVDVDNPQERAILFDTNAEYKIIKSRGSFTTPIGGSINTQITNDLNFSAFKCWYRWYNSQYVTEGQDAVNRVSYSSANGLYVTTSATDPDTVYWRLYG